MKRICFVATVPVAIHVFLRGYIHASARKWAVSMVTTPDDEDLLCDMNAKLVPVAIKRKIAPFHDLFSLLRLAIVFRAGRFDMVHSITPKAGLLAMFAARLVGVPNRIHTFTGQVWATKTGLMRCTLKFFDKLIVFFATRVLVDSPSQYDFLVDEGILPKDKGVVIGHGSICGVDESRFHPDINTREVVRSELNIGLEQIVILYLGRLNRDKGVLDLATSFANIAAQEDDVIMIMVGVEEDVTYTQVEDICGLHNAQVRRVNFTSTPERYMAAADVFCLPSYREGFGQVIIEAAACGIPSVASRIYGVSDAIEEGESGLLFTAGDVQALTQSLLKLIEDQRLRKSMGVKAQARTLELFSSKRVISEVVELYSGLLDQ